MSRRFKGLLVKRLMSMRRHRRQIQARNGSVASRGKSKGAPCQTDQTCQIGETKGYSGPYLPQDIWSHIHSLMPLRDAARAACVSRVFLCSWRSRPNLTFSNQTLGLNENACGKDEIARDFTSKVDQILKRHFHTSVKTLKLLSAPNHNARYRRYLDSWLQMAVTPGTEELTLTLAEHFTVKKYKFPCSILSHGNGDSIRHLSLDNCAFRPTVGLGCLRSLTRLDLFTVYIKGDELWCLLSNSSALEFMDISYCHEIVCMKIPCLQRLTHLSVTGCSKLQLIESKAPNLSSFHFESDHQVQLSLGETLRVKNLYIDCSGPICHSRAELASSMPNLETLGIHSSSELVTTPLASSKFLHLKSLSITLRGFTFSHGFDYFSKVSSPSLETFVLDVSQRLMEHPNYAKIRFLSLASTWVYRTCHMIRAWLS
uniref:F-box domain-containing protein n=1 Tax=Arundo donax TaxID=35708 RepID=A0A0A9BZB4_ARUDO